MKKSAECNHWNYDMHLRRLKDYAAILVLSLLGIFVIPTAVQPQPVPKTIIREVKEVVREVEVPCSNHLSKEVAFKILNSTVRIQGPNNSGSGVLLYSGISAIDSNYYSYVITNKHVVRREGLTVAVEKFSYIDGRQIEAVTTYSGKVVAASDIPDLALIEIKTTEKIEGSANLLFGPELDKIKLYDSILTAGCPLGNAPLITEGHMVVIEKTVIVSTAFAIFGNSGGGNFTVDGELIGISSRIASSEGNHPIGNLAMLIPSNLLADWLYTNDYKFILGDNFGQHLDDVLISRKKTKIFR